MEEAKKQYTCKELWFKTRVRQEVKGWSKTPPEKNQEIGGNLDLSRVPKSYLKQSENLYPEFWRETSGVIKKEPKARESSATDYQTNLLRHGRL